MVKIFFKSLVLTITLTICSCITCYDCDACNQVTVNKTNTIKAPAAGCLTVCDMRRKEVTRLADSGAYLNCPYPNINIPEVFCERCSSDFCNNKSYDKLVEKHFLSSRNVERCVQN